MDTGVPLPMYWVAADRQAEVEVVQELRAQLVGAVGGEVAVHEVAVWSYIELTTSYSRLTFGDRRALSPTLFCSSELARPE